MVKQRHALILLCCLGLVHCKTRRDMESAPLVPGDSVFAKPGEEPQLSFLAKVFVLENQQWKSKEGQGLRLAPGGVKAIDMSIVVDSLRSKLTKKKSALPSPVGVQDFGSPEGSGLSQSSQPVGPFGRELQKGLPKDSSFAVEYVKDASQVYFAPGVREVSVVMPQGREISDGEQVATASSLAVYKQDHRAGGVEMGTLSRGPEVKPISFHDAKYQISVGGPTIKESWRSSLLKSNISAHTKKLLKDPDFEPVAKVTVQGVEYSVSQILRDPKAKRDMAVLYAFHPKTKKIVPRFMYSSVSNGGWRVSPFIYSDDLIYSKGRGWHYTQETKPIKEIAVMMDRLSTAGYSTSKRSEQVDPYFFDDVRDNIRSNTYGREVDIVRPDFLKVISDCKVEKCFTQEQRPQDGQDLGSFIENLDFSSREMQAFVPDFKTTPVDRYDIFHPLIGKKAQVEVFEAELEGRTIEWHMAATDNGKVWIDRINYKDGQVSSYGTYAEVIDSGILTSKPFNYKQYATALKAGEEFLEVDKLYVDITPILNRLYPIKEYRKARGLPVGS